jgi:hypothetical protein
MESRVYTYALGDAIFPTHSPMDKLTGAAFTVHTLAIFLKKVGLIGKDDDYYVPDLYFDAMYPRSEPYAAVPHVRMGAGGAG